MQDQSISQSEIADIIKFLKEEEISSLYFLGVSKERTFRSATVVPKDINMFLHGLREILDMIQEETNETSAQINSSCPKCHKMLDAHHFIKNIKKDERTALFPGDFMICGYCATLSRFVPTLQLKPLSAVEQKEMEKAHPDLLRESDEVIAKIKSRRQT